MDTVRKAVSKVSVSTSNKSSSSSSSLDLNGGTGQSIGISAALASPNSPSSIVLATRPSSHVLSYWACSKLCAIFFIGGVAFGYTLRGRVRRWASNILKRLRDN
ncbi:unnamed protein product [Lupinus luteus]|uniref:Transmembrane protein n=1 Tax=Lupinus luteus TaxID=3873 RepID=A0AAV1W5Y9_LUPLU